MTTQTVCVLYQLWMLSRAQRCLFTPFRSSRTNAPSRRTPVDYTIAAAALVCISEMCLWMARRGLSALRDTNDEATMWRKKAGRKWLRWLQPHIEKVIYEFHTMRTCAVRNKAHQTRHCECAGWSVRHLVVLALMKFRQSFSWCLIIIVVVSCVRVAISFQNVEKKKTAESNDLKASCRRTILFSAKKHSDVNQFIVFM